MDSSDALSAALTIQSSASTASVVAGIRAWARRETDDRHCVLIGPPGSGRSHMIEALNSLLSAEGVIRPSPADHDWRAALAEPRQEGSVVLIDNVDGYDAVFGKTLFEWVVKHTLRLFATSRTFEGRLARLWENRLGSPVLLRLGTLSERPEDTREFLLRWLTAEGVDPADETVADTVQLILSLRLPRGFVDLSALLKQLGAQRYDFSRPLHAASWIDAYHALIGESKPRSRVVLLEGESDATYFRWVGELALGSADSELAIEACGSAARIVERSVACRNEGHSSVALFDFDRLGKKYFEDLRAWGHACLIISASFDPLENRAQDHVLQVVEIEDLLPIAVIEHFYEEMQRQPEVDISLPIFGLRRMVPRAEDKLDLARWVTTKRGAADAEQLLRVYNELRHKLSLSPLTFPASQPIDSVEAS